ncbi:WD40 repeat-like protein [Ophiobolus disseminans]|uniref:WD40 repeat-like protein n=1 Tax=Ophiobolus disseminans TaxID=1469910 RepID=A0A6A6ZHT7_9PLEO|nr:WD40 repeat-like protein [Ophiobolus disseminans]
MLPSAAELVARFLRSSGYDETLNSFILEAGLPSDVGSDATNPVTIETILEEKKAFDTSLIFEKLGLNDKDRKWSARAPALPVILSSLPSRSNILSVSVLELSLAAASPSRKFVAITTADRKLHLLNPTSPTYEVAHTYSSFQDSPILDVLAIDPHHILVASMSGKLVLYNTVKDKVVGERKDHTKYVVKLASRSEGDTLWVASAGWDAKVFLYKIGGSDVQLSEPTAVLPLPSIPETLAFVASPDDGTPVLLVARRDSTFLHFYTMPRRGSESLTLLGRQNLAPHSNAWVSFTPADVQVCPTDPSIAAIATSTTPHMKLLVVKLLIPTKQSSLVDANPVPGPNGTVTQASQARAELLVQDREEKAILVNVSTLAPQTHYSTPRLVWRPDGTGVYVSSDDGVVRGIETATGKLVATLEGHQHGSKLRCLWAGKIQASQAASSHMTPQESEFLISGGFDQQLILWHA